MNRRRIWLVGACALLVSGCGDKDGDGDGSSETGDGDGEGCGDGDREGDEAFRCDHIGDGDGDGDECPEGAPGCPCGPGCYGEPVCTDGLCINPDCVNGVEDCLCDDGTCEFGNHCNEDDVCKPGGDGDGDGECANYGEQCDPEIALECCGDNLVCFDTDPGNVCDRCAGLGEHCSNDEGPLCCAGLACPGIQGECA